MKKFRNVILSLFILAAIFMITGCLDLRENSTSIEPEYTVTYYDNSGNVITTVTNYVGVEVRDYQKPALPDLAGHTGKWTIDGSIEPDYSKINSNTDIFATYEAIKYEVVFVDENGADIPDDTETGWTNHQQVEHGSAAVAPTLTVEGYTLSWDKTFDSVTSAMTVQLVKAIKTYTVTYVNYDNTSVANENVVYNQKTTLNPDATKPMTAQYVYTFIGWDFNADGQIDVTPYTVKGDITARAIYVEDVRVYQVNVSYIDGSLGLPISRNIFVPYGSVADLSSINAVKPATAQYTYTFAGWDVNGDGIADTLPAVTGNASYTAVFTSTVNKYSVKFVDFDNKLIDEQSIEYGSNAVAPTSPTRKGYTFSSWEGTYTAITSAVTITAKYSINQYSYTFFDENGTTVIKTQTIDYGQPIVAPANPTKVSDVQYDYQFKAWTPVVPTVISDSDVTFVASYTSTVRKYMVTFYAENGQTILKQTEELYGSNATLPTPLPTKTGHSFGGWLINNSSDAKMTVQVLGVTNAVAKFNINTYKVIGRITFDLGGGDIGYLDKEVAEGYYGQTGMDIQTAVQAISWEKEGYSLVSWKLSDGTDVLLSSLSNFTMPAENTYLYPQYAVKKFTVKFFDEDGLTQIGTDQIVDWGKDATAPADPVKSNTQEWKYQFLAWSKSLTNIKADTEVVAIYSKTKQQYTVTFLDEDGVKVLGTSKVDYGTAAVEPKIERVGWTWTWSAAFDNVVDNQTVKATFSKKIYSITIYIGSMYYTYSLYYGDTFNPLTEIPLGGGNIQLTGNLTVRDSSTPTSKTYYEGQYVVEDVDVVSFDAEYIIK